jgi:hypothetical protein
MLCGAKKKDGTPCQRRSMPNGRCYFHGGKSLRGIASASYKTGKYSKYMPQRLLQQYELARDDPELLELRDDLALLDSRIGDILKRVDTGESGAIWKTLKAIQIDLLYARSIDDSIGMSKALNGLVECINRGHSDYLAWDELGKLLDQRRRFVESERKRLIELQQVITTERALMLVGQLAGIVRAHVTDRATLNAISTDLARILGPAPVERHSTD